MASAKEPPVTKAEAAATFTRAQQMIKEVLRLKKDLAAFPKGPGVATRAQIIQQLHSIVTAVEPRFKVTLPKVKAESRFLSFADPTSKKLAERLEVLGFVDRYGPLATSKDEGLEPRQFGEALGFFLSRLAEYTHTPSTQFSPYLMPGGGETAPGLPPNLPPP
jgi:hypothetical protein